MAQDRERLVRFEREASTLLLNHRGALDGDRIRTAGLSAYRARTDDLLFLVNWDQGCAYYWAE